MDRKGFTKIPVNIEINVDIFAILLGVDRTILNVNIEDGFKIEEIFLDECRYKDKVVMGDNSISNKYVSSQIKNENEDEGKDRISFICITKKDILQYPHPSLDKPFYMDDKNPLFNEKMKIYIDDKYKVIYDFISKTMLFKEGDIGIYEVFFNYKYRFLNMNNDYSRNMIIPDVNILCENTYTLNKSELEKLNVFLTKHNQAFQLLNSIIDNFTYSYKLLYNAKAFEQIITTLEMLFLKKYESDKTQNLSKRVATFIGNDDVEVEKLYNEVKSFYKHRSDSTHEGIDLNITKKALLYLKIYTRRAIKKYFSIIEEELSINPSGDFATIKGKTILKLQQNVITKINEGILPSNQKRSYKRR